MKLTIFALALALPVCGAEAEAPAPAAPAKKVAAKGKKKASNPTVYDAVQIWDKDGNRQIEGAEAEPLRAAVVASTEGVIKSLDADNDGKLSDGELAAMNAALKTPSKDVSPAEETPGKKKGKNQK